MGVAERRAWLHENGKMDEFVKELAIRMGSGQRRSVAWGGAFVEVGGPEAMLGNAKPVRVVKEKKVRPVKKAVEKPEGESVVELEVAGGRKCSYDRGVEWVAETLENEDVGFGDRPSDSAWAMREWARSGPLTKQSFWTTIYSKIAPAKAQRELEAVLEDDMRADERLVARVLRLAIRARAEAGA